MKTELRRQVVHASGVLVILFVFLFGKIITLFLVGLVLLVFIIMALYRYKKMRIIWPLRIFSKMEKQVETEILRFERRGEYPLMGAITFFTGAFFALILFPAGIAVPAIAVLALADAASTLIGKEIGSHKLPVNPKKSWEGSLTFFIVSVIILTFFVNPFKAVLISILVAFVEMIPIDDNLTIPMAVGVLVFLI